MSRNPALNTNFEPWGCRPAPHEAAWELYDMEADRTEMRNLAASKPRRVREMRRRCDAWPAAWD